MPLQHPANFSPRFVAYGLVLGHLKQGEADCSGRRLEPSQEENEGLRCGLVQRQRRPDGGRRLPLVAVALEPAPVLELDEQLQEVAAGHPVLLAEADGLVDDVLEEPGDGGGEDAEAEESGEGGEAADDGHLEDVADGLGKGALPHEAEFGVRVPHAVAFDAECAGADHVGAVPT